MEALKSLNNRCFSIISTRNGIFSLLIVIKLLLNILF